jgi:hypothetical protein
MWAPAIDQARQAHRIIAVKVNRICPHHNAVILRICQ